MYYKYINRRLSYEIKNNIIWDPLTGESFNEIDLKNNYLLIPNKVARIFHNPEREWSEEKAIWWYDNKYTLKIFQNIPDVGALVQARNQND